MSRQVIRDNTGRVEGWFDPDAAEQFDDPTQFDGQNQVGLNSRGWAITETLYHTPGDRWVLERESRWQGDGTAWRFVSDDTARIWLVTATEDEAVDRFWPETPAEAAGVGRPEVGPKVGVRFSEDMLAAIDAKASGWSATRAETIRRLVTAGLATRDNP